MPVAKPNPLTSTTFPRVVGEVLYKWFLGHRLNGYEKEVYLAWFHVPVCEVSHLPPAEATK